MLSLGERFDLTFVLFDKRRPKQITSGTAVRCTAGLDAYTGGTGNGKGIYLDPNLITGIQHSAQGLGKFITALARPRQAKRRQAALPCTCLCI
jgi:hypothetical protein